MELKKQPDVGRADILQLPLSMIRIEPGFNVRQNGPEKDAHVREIADSILAIKFRQNEPLVVYNDGTGAVIVEGHCRWEAVLLANKEGAGILRVPCLPLPKGTTEAERIMAMLAADGKKPLKPLEQADGVYRLINAGWSEEKIDQARGKTRGWAARMLELRGAPEPMRQAVANGEISPTLAVQMTRKGPLAAVADLEAARETLPAGKSRVTRKAVDRATPANNSRRVPRARLDPARKAITAFLAEWRTWTKRAPVRAVLTAEIIERAAALDEQVPHDAAAAD